MVDKTKSEMCLGVAPWLETMLRQRHPGCRVAAYQTSGISVRALIRRESLSALLPESRNYEFRADVTGVVWVDRSACLAFVNCVVEPITLKQVSLFVGYCRVARPLLAYLLSPAGVGQAVKSLILTYDRADILEYDWPRGCFPRRITLGTWSARTKGLDMNSLLPPGAGAHQKGLV